MMMDIVYHPPMIHFLQLAKQAACVYIPGYEMYIQQALLQIKSWFNPSDEQLNMIEQMMEAYY